MTCTWPATFSCPVLHSPKKQFGSDLFHNWLFLCCSLGSKNVYGSQRPAEMNWNILLQPLPLSNHHVWERKNCFPHMFARKSSCRMCMHWWLKDCNNSRRKKELKEQCHSGNDTTAPHPEYKARVMCTKCVNEKEQKFSLFQLHIVANGAGKQAVLGTTQIIIHCNPLGAEPTPCTCRGHHCESSP